MKNRLIIVEGPQGTGKTSLTNYLRDNIASSNLYRLAGQKDKTLTGKKYSEIMYKALLDYLERMQIVPMTILFDRTFFSEEVYARLGYKEYSFSDIYEKLVKKLNDLNYDIYFLSLYLEDEKLYEARLARERHHNYQAFSIENSSNQQRVYKELGEEIIKKYNNIKVFRIAMDNFEKAYKEINEILDIEPKTKPVPTASIESNIEDKENNQKEIIQLQLI